MFNTNDILTRLQNGESPETIAAEMSNTLNQAVEAYEAETAKATRQAVLEAAAANVVSSLLDYCNIICPEFVEDITDKDEDDLIRFLVDEADTIADAAKFVLKLEAQQEGLCTHKAPATDNGLCSHKAPTADDILAEFFKEIFLS